MYPDKRIALISVSIMAVLWEHLFYSNRFHTENFALIFELLAFYIIYKGFIKKQNIWFIKPKYSLLFALLSSFLVVIFRPGNIPFIPATFLFLIILNKSVIFSKKWLPLVIGLILAAVIALFLILTKLPQSGLLSYWHPENPLSWNILGVFSGFYESIVTGIPPLLYYAFLLGIVMFLVDFFIKFKKFKEIKNDSENIEFKSDILNILLILTVLFTFIFMVRPPAYEFRWFFPLITGMLVFTSKGITVFSDYIGMFAKSKALSVILIVVILSLGLFTQFAHADMIIKAKIGSYAEVKDAALWMKEHSTKADIIFSISKTQTAYYSERKTISYSLMNNGSEFDDLILKDNPKYLTVSIFEPHPGWIYAWLDENNETISPVKVYYTDKTHTEAVLAVYEFKS
jgi:hypothetical protein